MLVVIVIHPGMDIVQIVLKKFTSILRMMEVVSFAEALVMAIALTVHIKSTVMGTVLVNAFGVVRPVSATAHIAQPTCMKNNK